MDKLRIVIVNDQDEIIGHKERGTLVPADIYRVSGLWVQNSKGDILLAQRQLGKRHDPGKWGPAEEHNYFVQWYKIVVDKPASAFTLQKEEVQQVKWFTRTELAQDLKAHPERYLKGLAWAVENL